MKKNPEKDPVLPSFVVVLTDEHCGGALDAIILSGVTDEEYEEVRRATSHFCQDFKDFPLTRIKGVKGLRKWLSDANGGEELPGEGK